MSLFKALFAQKPTPEPPERTGPFDRKADAEAEAKQPDERFAEYLNSRRG